MRTNMRAFRDYCHSRMKMMIKQLITKSSMTRKWLRQSRTPVRKMEMSNKSSFNLLRERWGTKWGQLKVLQEIKCWINANLVIWLWLVVESWLALATQWEATLRHLVQNNGQNYLIINHSSHPLIPRNEGNERQHLIWLMSRFTASK